MLSCFKKPLSISLISLSILMGLQIPANSEELDLLRSIPLEISGYPSAETLPAQFESADQVLDILNSEANLLIHMEALRRAYFDLGPQKQEDLLEKLLARHREKDNDQVRFFDHGYAQLLYKRNKTGLYFLRKANDRMQNQFTSLAYAMAQAEADLIHEESTPNTLTTRKMDVIYKMKDALRIDKENHQPGFWPSFVRVIEKLKPMPAYQNFTKVDYSTVYVPYGNTDPHKQPSSAAVNYLASQETAQEVVEEGEKFSAASTSRDCRPDNSVKEELRAEMTRLHSSGQIDFNNSGDAKQIQFFRRETSPQYWMLVTDSKQNVLMNLLTPVGPYVIEDLEGDGHYEIVIRKYEYDPLNPVEVYRLDECGFQKDKAIESIFE